MKIDPEDQDWLRDTLLNKRIVCAGCGFPINSNTDNKRGGLHLAGTAACTATSNCKYYSLKYKPIDTRNLSAEFLPVKRYADMLKKYSETPMPTSTNNISSLYKRLSEVTKELSNIHEQLSITLPKKKELETEYSN
ncbi:hypothetical protein LRR18_16730, partial [Mangrovimonas sp. AS39]|uniref:hypothetical protein n=1 Tax=Mangrovimonas futianensis TaxID=2895523 RepID=UPI001E2C00D1